MQEIIWIYTIVSVLIVSATSLVGIITIGLNIDRLKRVVLVLVALSAGALFGDVFFHLIPGVFNETEDPIKMGWYIASGILLFFVLEKFLHWRHSHEAHKCEGPNCEEPIKPLGSLILVSDGLHNLIDGLVIGAAYLISLPVGIATTIAVIFHEIPQEIGDFGILIHSGFSKVKALLYNLASSLLSVIGAVVALALGSRLDNSVVLISAFAIGGFLYIAGSDLVPELNKTSTIKGTIRQFSAMFLGIFIMYLLLFIE